VAVVRGVGCGCNGVYGDVLSNSQGEDVVAGTRTPLPIAALERENPAAYAELVKIRRTLEQHYREMMDIEFTIQQGKLFMLQCRVGKRTAFAAIRIAVDMVREKLVSTDDGARPVEPDQLNQLLRPIFNGGATKKAVEEKRLVARGLNAGPGAASGRVVFHADDAIARAAAGERVILVRIETSPEDIGGMNAA